MKQALLIISCIALFTVSTFTLPRPTNEWLIIFGDNQNQIISAENVDEALILFRREHKNVRVFSIAQRSYVESIWIWLK